MIEYKIVADWDLEEFQMEVNDSLKHGWELYGNPFTTVERKFSQLDEDMGDSVWYHQALTRRRTK